MAREPDVALLMAAFVKKYVKICKKNVNNRALSAKNWLSQPKRFPTPALKHPTEQNGQSYHSCLYFEVPLPFGGKMQNAHFS